MDRNRSSILKIFEKTYGVENASIWFQRWRIFFMSCEKLFGYNSGREWESLTTGLLRGDLK